MITLRSNVFETNSSSSHTISLANNGYNRKLLPIEVDLTWENDFGWNFKKWSSIEEKIEYLVRSLVRYDYLRDDNGYITYDGNVEEKLNNCIKPIQKRLHDLGVDFNMPSFEEYEDGSLDHPEYYYDEIKEIYDSDDDLLSFLLNPNSYVMGGNDNE